MQFKCDDFEPFTHPEYAIAGCYGCANANINIDIVWCSKEHWCLAILLPLMPPHSKFFECDDCIHEEEHALSLCEDCTLLDEKNCCTLGKELRELVVRFD
jgi:hypothetical protein